MSVKEVSLRSDEPDEAKQIGTFLISSFSSMLKIAKDGTCTDDMRVILNDIENINANLWGLMALAGDINTDNHAEIYEKLNKQLDETISRYRDMLEYVIKESRNLHERH